MDYRIWVGLHETFSGARTLVVAQYSDRIGPSHASFPIYMCTLRAYKAMVF